MLWKQVPTVLIGLLGCTTVMATQELEVDYLTGDRRLACEAILCMSSSQRPSECNASLRRYFSIKHKKAWKTRNARRNFLKLCPESNANPSMVTLVDTIVNAAGNCTAEALNNSTRYQGGILRAHRVRYDDDSSWHRYRYEYYYEPTVERDNQLPSYCKAYFDHEYTDFSKAGITPVYIGKKGEGGFWAEWQQRDAAQVKYEAEAQRRAKIAEETKAMCTTSAGYNRCQWP